MSDWLMLPTFSWNLQDLLDTNARQAAFNVLPDFFDTFGWMHIWLREPRIETFGLYIYIIIVIIKC